MCSEYLAKRKLVLRIRSATLPPPPPPDGKNHCKGRHWASKVSDEKAICFWQECQRKGTRNES